MYAASTFVNAIYRRWHSGIKARYDYRIAILRFNIHRLFAYRTIMNDIMASMLYINIAQTGDVVRPQRSAHPRNLSADRFNITRLRNKCIAPFENTNPLRASGYCSSHRQICAIHMTLRAHRNGYRLSDLMYAHCQRCHSFRTDIPSGQIGNIPHIFHLYAIHTGIFQHTRFIPCYGQNSLHIHYGRVIQR